jgi:hypothetical protein
VFSVKKPIALASRGAESAANRPTVNTPDMRLAVFQREPRTPFAGSAFSTAAPAAKDGETEPVTRDCLTMFEIS